MERAAGARRWPDLRACPSKHAAAAGGCCPRACDRRCPVPGRQWPAIRLGASGENDFVEAVKTAVINKRAGGMGLISGRKAFQRPMKEGVQLLNAIQDVYLDKSVTVA